MTQVEARDSGRVCHYCQRGGTALIEMLRGNYCSLDCFRKDAVHEERKRNERSAAFVAQERERMRRPKWFESRTAQHHQAEA